MAIGPIKRIVFDPNARDGDNDGKIQEGTPFERPKTPSAKPVADAVTGAAKTSAQIDATKRTKPLRDTQISESDISKGGMLKTSKVFEADLMKRLNEKEQASFLGVTPKMLKRMKEDDASINSFAADRIAINAFGYHPIEIWGDAWMEEQILRPQLESVPPRKLTDMENNVLELRKQGLTDSEMAKKLGVSRERIRQIRNNALKKRDQESLMDDKQIEEQMRTVTAKETANAVFLDTGTSPTGLIGRMSGELDDNHPMWESPTQREDREQAYADFIYENYLEPWESDFWKNEGKSPTESDLLDFVATLDRDQISVDFEQQTGTSAWGLEFDEEGNAHIAEWAEAGFLSEEDYDDWFDGPMADIISGSGRDASNDQGSLFDDYAWDNYVKSEEYTTYGGTDPLLERNKEQHKKFSDWAAAKDWKQFHKEHFDWWAFPIDEVSNTYGERFRVPDEEVAKLRGDNEFLKRLDENLTNASSAYGWDIKAQSWIPDSVRDPDQIPQTLMQVRLYKMARSALVFGRCAHFESLKRMYDNLASFGWYPGEDLGFWRADHNCSQT